jgi:hypothetical protein
MKWNLSQKFLKKEKESDKILERKQVIEYFFFRRNSSKFLDQEKQMNIDRLLLPIFFI